MARLFRLTAKASINFPFNEKSADDEDSSSSDDEDDEDDDGDTVLTDPAKFAEVVGRMHGEMIKQQELLWACNDAGVPIKVGDVGTNDTLLHVVELAQLQRGTPLASDEFAYLHDSARRVEATPKGDKGGVSPQGSVQKVSAAQVEQARGQPAENAFTNVLPSLLVVREIENQRATSTDANAVASSLRRAEDLLQLRSQLRNAAPASAEDDN